MLKKITLIGTGLMGYPMGVQLLKAGYSLQVWNRTIDKVKGLEDLGAVVASSPGEAARSADVVITMLSNGEAVSDVLTSGGVAKAMKPGAIFVDMSSVTPSQAREHFEILSKHEISALDAPVSGGTKGAQSAQLAIMAGGDPDAFERVRPVLEAMGAPVLVGPTGTGALAKLANQAIVAVTICAVAEATLLLEKGGADVPAVRKALAGGFADSIILRQHGDRMTRRDFEPGGPCKMQLKDLNNLVNVAETLNLTLPHVEKARSRFEDLCSRLDGGNLDHSAIFLELLDINKS
ncbi:MAG: NAD(P)-dependent oxidoreductase [Magnetovibrio sp.]|nr:NAD(P)-dependent oxidoreductase [Magnetovibrio sp.]